jgi:DNA-binding NtrC family response regulator
LNPTVIFVSIGRERSSLETILELNDIQVLQCRSIRDLEIMLQKIPFAVTALDLDEIPLDDRLIKEMALKCPSLKIIGFSNRHFHPELKESMKSYIYAAISKPVDSDELIYLVKSFFRDLPAE